MNTAGKHGVATDVPAALTAAEVHTVADLARLALTPEQVEAYRAPMASVLGYMDRLRTLDLTGVEPMSHPNDSVNRLDADEPNPSETLPTDVLMRMSPDTAEPFVRVPGVFAGE